MAINEPKALTLGIFDVPELCTCETPIILFWITSKYLWEERSEVPQN